MKTSLILLLTLFLVACGDANPPLKTWHLVPGGITAAAVADNHALLASIDQGAQWWQLKPKKLLHTFRHGGSEPQEMIAVAVTADGRFAVTTDRGGLAWWDTRSGRPLASWALAGIQTLTLSADGQWALIGLEDRAVYFSLRHGKTRFAFSHDRPVKTVALDRQGRLALTGSDDGTAKLWDLRTGTLRHTWKQYGKLAAVVLSPRGTYALTNPLLGPIQVWKTATGKLKRRLGPRYITVTRAAFTPKESLLATGHPSQGIKLWSLRRGKLLRQFLPRQAGLLKPTSAPVLALRFVRGSRQLLSATSDGSVQLWSIRGKKKK